MLEKGMAYWQRTQTFPFRSVCDVREDLPMAHWIYDHIGPMPVYRDLIQRCLDGEDPHAVAATLDARPDRRKAPRLSGVPVRYSRCLRCDKIARGLCTTQRLCQDCRRAATWADAGLSEPISLRRMARNLRRS